MLQTANFKAPNSLQRALLQQWEELSQREPYPATTSFDLFNRPEILDTVFVMELVDNGWEYTTVGEEHEMCAGVAPLSSVDLTLECDGNEEELLSLCSERRFSYASRRVPVPKYGAPLYTVALCPVRIPGSSRPSIVGLSAWYDDVENIHVTERSVKSEALTRTNSASSMLNMMKSDTVGNMNAEQRHMIDLILMEINAASSLIAEFQDATETVEPRRAIGHHG